MKNYDFLRKIEENLELILPIICRLLLNCTLMYAQLQKCHIIAKFGRWKQNPIDIEKRKEVNEFEYLDSMITQDGRSKGEIKNRRDQTQTAYLQKEDMFRASTDLKQS